ncbi:transcriptional regulator [Clostridium sp. P21]|uniref:Transcriptional regulator n=1 Tax=Clostridium muellerianum TaxID=2716538 RepID=A0A7Y0EE97_9CLOT|nr:zinc ribbon domain-containing protein [Clostridium muellerianum]NMM61850.1 transcriptional regulator [Clostridium muellerianum]
MEQKYCQSCGMPMNEEVYGTEINNEKNKEYCIYCYENGAFTQPDLTMEQMIDACMPFMKDKGMDENEARNLMKNCLPALKRWRKEEPKTRITEKNKMIIVGKEIRTTNKDGECIKAISELWKEFSDKKFGDEILNKTNPDEILGLYCDYENKEFGLYSFIIGYEVSDINSIPQDMTYKILPSSKYCIVTAKDKIGAAWSYIWNSNLQRTYSGDFELYGKKYDGIENSEVDIYVAVK